MGELILNVLTFGERVFPISVKSWAKNWWDFAVVVAINFGSEASPVAGDDADADADASINLSKAIIIIKDVIDLGF